MSESLMSYVYIYIIATSGTYRPFGNSVGEHDDKYTFILREVVIRVS